jgi:hypothetical protein
MIDSVESKVKKTAITYEECHLLGCYARWLLQKLMFERKVLPPS